MRTPSEPVLRREFLADGVWLPVHPSITDEMWEQLVNAAPQAHRTVTI